MIDFESITELNNLYNTLEIVTKELEMSMDELALLKNEVFSLMATEGIPDKISFESKLIALKKKGFNTIVDNFNLLENNVSKLKNRLKQCYEAINIKKHINNTLPK